MDRTFVALAAGEVVGVIFVIESGFGFGKPKTPGPHWTEPDTGHP